MIEFLEKILQYVWRIKIFVLSLHYESSFNCYLVNEYLLKNSEHDFLFVIWCNEDSISLHLI